MSAGLADLLEDVEHVMIEFDDPALGAEGGATATSGMSSVLTAASRTQRVLSIVGDGARETVEAYAARRGCTLEQAVRSSVFVGASVAGVQAAVAAGVVCVGYANSPGERRGLEECGVGVVIADMHELADALNARWDAAWCANQGCC